MVDTYTACQPFLPLSRLFCSAVFRLQNVLTEPLEKPLLDWAGTHIANHCIRITNQYRSHPVSQRYPPVFFHAFYGIFENLIEFHHFYLKMGGFPAEKARKYGWLSCRFHRNTKCYMFEIIILGKVSFGVINEYLDGLVLCNLDIGE